MSSDNPFDLISVSDTINFALSLRLPWKLQMTSEKSTDSSENMSDFKWILFENSTLP